MTTKAAAYPLNRADARMVLRADVSLRSSGPVLDLYEDQYQFSGIGTPELHAVATRLDGKNKVGAIADETGVPLQSVIAIVDRLVATGLAANVSEASPVVDAGEVAVACRRLFPLWKERLFGGPLWTGLTAGTAKHSQLVGWLVESYHFIEGVNDRLPLVVAECPSRPVRELFLHHFSEEYDHARFFLDSLNALGYSDDAVIDAPPLPSTLAILNFMRRCARRDPLQYAVCSGFLESTGGERSDARSFFKLVQQNYADSPRFVEPLIAHVDLDEEYGHNALLEAVCERIGPVLTDHASAALDAGARLVEILETWSSDILRSYEESAPRGVINKYRQREAVAVDMGHVSEEWK
ncbi:iron-containing redox enzyme family protein [Streptomyces sp. NBC_00207]|uniref:iron-containing redox enzyme family protein n=1 Tax=unclassified Streptomyces TaxID=2593676 RepID=UPI0028841C0A|nr:iron-containing redox enzyme family protein [Streptomyces sp. DSM 41633]